MKWFLLLILTAIFTPILFGQLNCWTMQDSSACYINKKFNAPSKIVLEKKIESIDSLLDPSYAPLVVDLNEDCTPEILIRSQYLAGIYSIDPSSGKTLDTLFTAGFKSAPTGFAIADVDKDGVPEIFVATVAGNLDQVKLIDRIICYRPDGSIKWISDTFQSSINHRLLRSYDEGNLAFADFNQDGISEIKSSTPKLGCSSVMGGIMVSGLVE